MEPKYAACVVLAVSLMVITTYYLQPHGVVTDATQTALLSLNASRSAAKKITQRMFGLAFEVSFCIVFQQKDLTFFFLCLEKYSTCLNGT